MIEPQTVTVGLPEAFRRLHEAARGCEFDLTPADGPIARLMLFVHANGDAILAALAQDRTCAASPDHADIMATIANAADTWLEEGYTSALAEVRDMANVGRSLMEEIANLRKCEGPFKGWAPADDPAEIVVDMANALHDALALDRGEVEQLRSDLRHAASDMMLTPRHNRGNVADRHIDEARDRIRAALTNTRPAEQEASL